MNLLCMQNVFDIDYVHINIIYIYIEVQNVDKYVNIHVLCISSDVLTDSESAI